MPEVPSLTFALLSEVSWSPGPPALGNQPRGLIDRRLAGRTIEHSELTNLG